MTGASKESQLASAWREHGLEGIGAGKRLDADLMDAAGICGVVSPALWVMVRSHSRPLTSSSIRFTTCPPKLFALGMESKNSYLYQRLMERHRHGALDRVGPELVDVWHRWMDHSALEAVRPPVAKVLLAGHGAALTMWRANRPTTGTHDHPRQRREALAAILAKPRLSRRVQAELLGDLGLSTRGERIEVQGELLPDEVTPTRATGLRIRPADANAALAWSRHPSCDPELAFLIQMTLAGMGEAALAVALVSWSGTHPLVLAEARRALVQRMSWRPRGQDCRFLALSSPWCPPAALKAAAGSPYPHERLAADLHSGMQEEWRQAGAVVMPQDSGLRDESSELKLF